MKFCQALNREITPKECEDAQKPRQLPKKFCEGCNWFGKKLIRKRNSPLRYRICVTKKLKDRITENAQKCNLEPGRYIVKILNETLLNE